MGSGSIGAAFFVGLLIDGDSLFSAFWMGCVAAFAAMALSATAKGLWEGQEVESAQGPGGWGVKFFGATRRTVRLLSERVADQMTTVNQRLYELEKAVFKGSDEDPGGRA